MSAARWPEGGWAEPLVRVVVVTFSPGESLEHCLSSIPEALSAPYEVLLVDNGSTDGFPERAELDHGVRLLHTGSNIGYGGAANIGARGATSPWLLVLNPDVTFSPGSLDRLLDAADRWPDAGVLGPAVLTEDGRLYPSARAIPSLTRGIGHALFGWWWPTNPWTAAYRREREVPVERRTGWLSGACLLLRRSAFEAVGGFDPSYFMYFEDLDLCERLSGAGFDVVYVPDAVVTHSGGHATSRDVRRMSRAHHTSAYLYLSRKYSGPLMAPLRALIKAGLAFRYAMSVRIPKVAHGAQPVQLGLSVAADVRKPLSEAVAPAVPDDPQVRLGRS